MTDGDYVELPLHGELGKGKTIKVDRDNGIIGLQDWWLVDDTTNKKLFVARKHRTDKKTWNWRRLGTQILPPEHGKFIVHKNGDPLDFRTSNLEYVDKAERMNEAKAKAIADGTYRAASGHQVRANRKRPRSGYYYVMQTGKFGYRVVAGGATLPQIFVTAKQAAIEADKLAKELWGDEALLNFPEEND